MGDAELARYGLNGIVDGGHQRFSIKDVHVTPNHHAIARQWAFSDNFYADCDGTVDGHHWLTGVYPNAWTESSLLAAYGDMKDFRMSAAPGRLSFPGSASSVQPEDAAAARNALEPPGQPRDFVLQLRRRASICRARAAARHGPLGARFLTDMPMPAALYYAHLAASTRASISPISDQDRASAFIREVDEKFVKAGADLPQFLFVYLPGDAAGAPNAG